MSKKKDETSFTVPATVEIVEEDKQPKTNKKYLKEAEKIVRKMDSLLSDIFDLRTRANDLEMNANTTEIDSRDARRFSELVEVLSAVQGTLYWLTERMARKYVGKEISALGSIKERKPLK